MTPESVRVSGPMTGAKLMTNSFRVLCCGLAAGLLAAATLPAQAAAVVKADRTNLRAKPAFDGEVLATLKKGDPVEVLDEVPGTGADGQARPWSKVALPKQVSVWVYGALVDAKTKTVRGRGKVLNLRAGPGPNYSILGEVKAGEALTVLRELDGWLQIEPPAGTFAFVSANLIEPSPTQVAVIKPASPVALPERASPPVPAPAARKLPESAPPVGEAVPKLVATPPVQPEIRTPAPVVIQPAPVVIAPPKVVVDAAEVAVPPRAAKEVPPAPRKFLRYDASRRTAPVEPDFMPSAGPDAKPREVLREGTVSATWSVQAPGYLELLNLQREGRIDYLISEEPDLDLTKFRGQHVFVGGEEWLDSRWKTPVLKVKSIRAVE